MEEITIREATKEDCDAIMRNIKVLCLYRSIVSTHLFLCHSVCHYV